MIQNLERPKKRYRLAIALMIGGTVALAAQAVFVKLASPYFSTNFLCFARSIVNLIMLMIWVFCSPIAPKVSELFRAENYRHHAVRSICGVAALYCFYFSITNFSLAEGTLIFYSFPLFVPIVARLWLRVKLVHRLWWGLGIAFLGLMFVLRPGNNLFNPWSIVPLVGAMLSGTAVVAVRTLNYTEPWERITAYYFTLSTLVTGVVFYLFPVGEETYTFTGLAFAFLAGVFAAIFQILLTLSAKFAPMRLLSPFIYLSFIFGAIAQYFIWGESLLPGVIIGFFLIVVGTALLIFLYPKNDLQFKPKRVFKKSFR